MAFNKAKNTNTEIWQPMGLNLLSVFLSFSTTTLVTLYLECNTLFYGCLLCLITGTLNHSTYWKIFRYADLISTQLCFVYFTYSCAVYHYYYYLSLLSVLFVGLGYKVVKLSFNPNYGIVFHSILHVVGNIGIALMALGCYSTSSCTLCNK